MTQKLVQSYNYEQWLFVPFQVVLNLSLRSILDGFHSWLPVCITQVYILESEILSNVIIVGDIYSNWNSWWSKRKYFQTGEIWLFENIHLKLWSPWQMSQ